MNITSNLAGLLGITEQSLADRRRFVRLDDEDRTLLQGLIPWIESVSTELASDFYDYQFSFEPTVAFFNRYSQETGSSLGELRQGLEAAQVQYLEEVFRGARTNWDLSYFEHRLHIGAVHEKICLPLKWYLGSYAEWDHLLRGRLLEHYEAEEAAFEPAPQAKNDPPPEPRPTPGDRVAETMSSIWKIFNLDMQAVADAFLVTTLEAMGLSVGDIETQGSEDRTEYLQQVKKDMALLAHQAETLASDVIDVEVLNHHVSGTIGQGFAAVANKVRTVAGSVTNVSTNIASVATAADELAISSTEISERTTEVANLSAEAAAVADRATSAVGQLSESSNQIDKVVGAIAVVAAQTNLLALNATIEAARAGEAGKGFSVVANEVKNLASQTAEATVDIESQIKEIRDEITNAVAAIDSIVERVRSVNELQTTMAGAVEEQSIAVRELERNLTEAAEAVTEISEQVRTTDEPAGEFATV